jgi:hypothetical protein
MYLAFFAGVFVGAIAIIVFAAVLASGHGSRLEERSSRIRRGIDREGDGE